MKKITKFVDKQVQKLVLSTEQQHIDQDFQPFPSQPYLTYQDPSQYYSNPYQSPQYPHPSPSATSPPPPGYPCINNNYSAAPSTSQENQLSPSPPPVYNPPQSADPNHPIPPTPVQTPITNNPIYSTPPITPPSVPPFFTTAQPQKTSLSSTHPQPGQHTPQQQHSQFSNGHNPSSDPVPPPIQKIPSHIIYGKRLLDDETIQQAITRIHSARVVFGDIATADARKGLSRKIQIGNPNDIELFGNQLKNSQMNACELNYENFTDKVLCIAVSYVHYEHPIGRFKFSPEQWNSLKVALANLFHSNVIEVRLWLDQCLWIRDVNQESWAHTGLVPYVIWPVISLGVKRYKHDRTTASFSRMWPFVEELAGLWSMGLMITKEMRSGNTESGNRSVLSYNLRHRLEPENSMLLLLINIYHGAADDHETGWEEDVEELREMALLNMSTAIEGIAIGSDWRSKIAQGKPRSLHDLLNGLQLMHWHEYLGGINYYLEGSRRIVKGSEGRWDGTIEWMSGNRVMVPISSIDLMLSGMTKVEKFNILTNKGEFQILGRSYINSGIWLLVAMDGRSSNFSRGRVAWTKVIHGENSCNLSATLANNKLWVVENVLREQTNEAVRITHMECVSSLPIEWT